MTVESTFDYFEYSGSELDETLSNKWIKDKFIAWTAAGNNDKLDLPTMEVHAGDRLQFTQGKFVKYCPHE